MPFTSFVETGTYRWYSTELIASRFPKLPVFTVEVVPATYDRSRRFLGRYPNVTTMLGSSDDVVKQLLDEHKAGDLPLFYLDAHWQQYWPLRKELAHIGAAAGRAVIVIDDFEVPGNDRFGYDIDGGGDVTAGEKCNLAYIRPALNPDREYHALFPKYSMADAFGPGKTGALRGHVVLFQNLPAEYEAFLRRPLVREHYCGHGQLPCG